MLEYWKLGGLRFQKRVEKQALKNISILRIKTENDGWNVLKCDQKLKI